MQMATSKNTMRHATVMGLYKGFQEQKVDFTLLTWLPQSIQLDEVERAIRYLDIQP